MCERVKTRLGKLSDSRDAGNGSVDTPKSGKAENLGGIIPSMRVSMKIERLRYGELLTRWPSSKEAERRQIR